MKRGYTTHVIVYIVCAIILLGAVGYAIWYDMKIQQEKNNPDGDYTPDAAYSKENMGIIRSVQSSSSSTPISESERKAIMLKLLAPSPGVKTAATTTKK